MIRKLTGSVTDRRTLFVSCSATIAKPKQHMQNVFGIEVRDLVATLKPYPANSLNRMSKRSRRMAHRRVVKTTSCGTRPSWTRWTRSRAGAARSERLRA